MITKTDFMLFLKVPMHLWASKHGQIEVQPTLYEQHLMKQGKEIEGLARIFLEENYLKGSDVKLEFERTYLDGEFQSRADAVARDPKEETIDIYEIKSATSVRKEDLYDVTFQRLVCEATETVRDVFIVHVNKEYIHAGDLNLQKMFQVVNLNEEIEGLRDEVTGAREEASRTASLDSPDGIETCLKPKDCLSPSLCHGPLPERPIYDLPRLHRNKVLDLKSSGVLSIQDIPDDYPLSETQSQHRAAVKTGQPLINIPAIKAELDQLEFPLQFLDYETYGPGTPYFSGYKPYQSIVYQYSLHVLEREGDELKHYENLLIDEQDPGIRFVEQLTQDIRDTGTVIVWNKPFEAGKNKEMAERYPEYKDGLLNINDRMYDLMEIFRKGYYIDPDFRGSASLKNVLPVLVPEFERQYQDLEISSGEEAMLAWGDIREGKVNEKKITQIREDLLAYCKLDTLAMVKIWEKLREVVDSKK